MGKFGQARRGMLGGIFAGIAAAASPIAVNLAWADSPLVVFLLPENVTARWESQDKPFFIEAMKKDYPDAQVRVENALNDP